MKIIWCITQPAITVVHELNICFYIAQDDFQLQPSALNPKTSRLLTDY